MTQTTTHDEVTQGRFSKAFADTRDILAQDTNIDRLADRWLGLCAASIGQAALFYAEGGDLVGWRAFADGKRSDILTWRIPAQSIPLYSRVMNDRHAAICTAPEFSASAGAGKEARALTGRTRDICLVPLVIGGRTAGVALFGSENRFAPGAAAALEGLTGLFAARVLEIYRSEACAPTSSDGMEAPETALSGDDERRMRKILSRIESLPAMPTIAGKVLEMVEDADTSVKDLQRLINNDPILAAKILKVANSSYYCGGMDVATLSEAIVILGFNILRSLIIAASMRSLYVHKPSRRGTATVTRFAAHQKSLWEHSVACAAVARNIAKKINYENPEAAFVAGLLHDIGRLVMFKEMPEESARWLYERGTAPAQNILASEKEIFSFDHCMVGAAVAKKWNLADEVATVIGHHHFAETGVAPTPLSAIADFANSICLKNQIGPIAMPSLDLNAELKRLPLPLRESDVKEIADQLSRILAAEALFL